MDMTAERKASILAKGRLMQTPNIDLRPLKAFAKNSLKSRTVERLIADQPDIVSATDLPAIAKLLLDSFDREEDES